MTAASDRMVARAPTRRRHAAIRLRLGVVMLAIGAAVAGTAVQAQPAYDAAYVSETVPSQIEPFTA